MSGPSGYNANIGVLFIMSLSDFYGILRSLAPTIVPREEYPMLTKDVKDWPEWADGNGTYAIYYTRYCSNYYAFAVAPGTSQRDPNRRFTESSTMHPYRIHKLSPYIADNNEMVLLSFSQQQGKDYISERKSFADVTENFEVDLMEWLL